MKKKQWITYRVRYRGIKAINAARELVRMGRECGNPATGYTGSSRADLERAERLQRARLVLVVVWPVVDEGRGDTGSQQHGGEGDDDNQVVHGYSFYRRGRLAAAARLAGDWLLVGGYSSSPDRRTLLATTQGAIRMTRKARAVTMSCMGSLLVAGLIMIPLTDPASRGNAAAAIPHPRRAGGRRREYGVAWRRQFGKGWSTTGQKCCDPEHL